MSSPPQYASNSSTSPGTKQEASETTPLLNTAESSVTVSAGSITSSAAAPLPNHHGAVSTEDKPLPVFQMICLCYVRLVEPVAFFSIFPFVNQMVQTNGDLPAASVGFYSGLIESMFSLTQMFCLIAWGRASDRFGRKPVLVAALAGVSVATAAFGMSKTIWQMILLRSIAGMFAGIPVTVRTMISEVSTQKTQARAFSYFAFSGNIGIFVGPLIGGALAEPAKQYGGFWKSIPFFEQYPYALSTFVTGFFGVTAMLVAIFCVEETLKRPEPHGEGSNGEPDTVNSKPPSISALMQVPGAPIVLFLFAYVAMLAFAYTAVLPIHCFTPQRLGGFGFSELQISIMMAATGAAQAIWLLLVFPPLQRRIGTRGVMRWCSIAYPVFLAVCPLCGLLLRYGDEAAVTAFWILLPTLLCLGVGVSMSFTAVQLALNDVSPSPRALGTMNSIAQAFSSGVRAFTPVAFSSLFAVGAENNIIDGQLAWVVMVLLAVVFSVATVWLPKATDDGDGSDS